MGSNASLVQHGGWPFLITSAIGRLPPAMVQLGLLMYVAQVGLGLGLGGFTVAAVGLGTAISATIMGRFVDAFGPLPVVVSATVVQVSGLVAIAAVTPALVAGDLPPTVLLALAAVCGLANPQLGPIVRSRWSHLGRRYGNPQLVRQALGYEGAVDEMSFIIGPVAASTLVAGLGPDLAIRVLMGIIIVGQGVFCLYLWSSRADWDRGSSRARATPAERLPMGALLPPMIVLLSVGITFGATQTALAAVNDARGTDHLTGIVYGAVGIGSACSSVFTPRLPDRVTLRMRLAFGAVGLLLAGAGFALLPTLWPALIIAILMGVGIGVVLVTGFARAEEVAPRSRVASSMTMLSMCLTLGVSIGAAIAGQLSDVLWHGYIPVLCAGVLALVAASFVGHGRPRKAWNA